MVGEAGEGSQGTATYATSSRDSKDKATTDRMMAASKEPGCTIVCDQRAESNANNSLRTHLGAVMKLPVTAADCTPLLSVAVTETL